MKIDNEKKTLVTGDRGKDVLEFTRIHCPRMAFLWPEIEDDLPCTRKYIMQKTVEMLQNDFPVWIATMHEIPLLAMGWMCRNNRLDAKNVQLIYVREDGWNNVLLDKNGDILDYFWVSEDWEIGFRLRFDLISEEDFV